jgi:hypothetical protein
MRMLNLPFSARPTKPISNPKRHDPNRGFEIWRLDLTLN